MADGYCIISGLTKSSSKPFYLSFGQLFWKKKRAKRGRGKKHLSIHKSWVLKRWSYIKNAHYHISDFPLCQPLLTRKKGNNNNNVQNKRQVHSLIFEVIIIIFFHWEMEKGRIQPNYRLHVVCNLHLNGRKPLYYIPSTIHHLEIQRLSNLLKHGGLQLLSIISSTEKLV